MSRVCVRFGALLLFIWVVLWFQGCGSTIRQVKTLPQAESIKTTFVMKVNISNAENTRMLNYKVRIPVNINYRQKILAMRFTPEPDSIEDDGSERYAEYMLINPPDNMELKLEFDMEIYRYDMSLASTFPVDPYDELKPSKFVKDEKKIESDDPEVLKIAEEITGKDRVEIVKNIYAKVLETLEYDKSLFHTKSWKGAKKSAAQGAGVCSDYADLFVALCRAKNIPARYVSGFVVTEHSTNEGHAWCEVYFEDKGWVRFDPTWGDNLLSDTDFYHNTPSYVEIMRSRRDTSTIYYYSGSAPEISMEVASENIQEFNTFNSKAASDSFENLIKDAVFRDMLARYRNIYCKYAESLNIDKEFKDKLIRITNITFKEESLSESDVSELADFIKEIGSKTTTTRFSRQLDRRYMWLAGYRLKMETRDASNGSGGKKI